MQLLFLAEKLAANGITRGRRQPSSLFNTYLLSMRSGLPPMFQFLEDGQLADDRHASIN